MPYCIHFGPKADSKITMKDTFGLFEPTISISYALLLLEITSDRGITIESVLENSGLTVAGLDQPEARMSAHQWSRLVLNALRLTQDSRLGITYGLRLRPTSHGALGYAFLSSTDIETALNLATTYFHTRIQSFSFSWQADDSFVYTYLDDVHAVKMGDQTQSHQLRCFLVESLLYGVVYFLSTLSADIESESEIFVDWHQPQSSPYDSRSEIPIYFNNPKNSIRFPKKYLTYKNMQADSVAFKQALIYCEDDKAKFKGDTKRDLQKSIRAELIYSEIHGYPTLTIIASRLNMSERTLKRHLQEQGTSFTAILNEVRFKEAKRLLQLKQYDIKDIAHEVGYNEATNFIRAFKKEFGETPSQYRKRNA